ncbi:AAA domain-containing protein [Amycolatopsis tolypomycina]|uniref:AAA domain-containing protein n=1 Tax=Amycolatopsis tolypomycina TaxID=208445 RepID=A0A1H4JLT2_9PSEU|nr:AAA domain-containing protein [Amycolatopsis tolypomycina]
MAGVERSCGAGMLVGVLGYEKVGSPSSLLIIVRGPSGSGKSSVAKSVRQRHGRGMAVLGQDVIRRSLLWERKDVSGGLAPDFIAHSAGFLLNAGWPVLVEGILSAAAYGPALRELMTAHRGRTLVYFLQVELAETFSRHATRPEADEFSITDMASWFEPDDRLDVPGEIVIPQSSSLADTVDRICRDARLAPVGDDLLTAATPPPTPPAPSDPRAARRSTPRSG